jgi:CSLREA domain-containing protein
VKSIARRRALLVPVLAVALILPAAEVAQANVLGVDTTADTSGDVNICTLRDAITVTNNDNGAAGRRGLSSIGGPLMRAFLARCLGPDADCHVDRVVR